MNANVTSHRWLIQRHSFAGRDLFASDKAIKDKMRNEVHDSLCSIPFPLSGARCRAKSLLLISSHLLHPGFSPRHQDVKQTFFCCFQQYETLEWRHEMLI